jgi:hypothetical protein
MLLVRLFQDGIRDEQDLVAAAETDPAVSHFYFIVSRRERAMGDEAKKVRGFLLDQMIRAVPP